MTIFLLLSVKVTRKNWALINPEYLSLFFFFLSWWCGTPLTIVVYSQSVLERFDSVWYLTKISKLKWNYCSIVICYLFPFWIYFLIITQSVIFFINSFSIFERVYIRLSFLFNYYLHVETVPANMGARQVRDHYNIILSFSRIREPWLWAIIK